jgi:SAM-dependent methyltransferase
VGDGLPFDAVMAAYRQNRFMPAPPRARDFTTPANSAQDFRDEGANLASVLVAAGLRPSDSVLDLGSGIGRVALPLTQYLTGKYFGLDINLSGVAWCHENISQAYPNFQFGVINARNDNYGHPGELGQDRLERASIPIAPDVKFDFVFAYSLFTHLDWVETEFYLRFVGARLNPGGTFFSTWFLINDDARRDMSSGCPSYQFEIDSAGPTFLVKDLQGGPGPVAHSESALLVAAAAVGLRPIGEIAYSGWPKGTAGQDVVVLRADS